MLVLPPTPSPWQQNSMGWFQRATASPIGFFNLNSTFDFPILPLLVPSMKEPPDEKHSSNGWISSWVMSLLLSTPRPKVYSHKPPSPRISHPTSALTNVDWRATSYLLVTTVISHLHMKAWQVTHDKHKQNQPQNHDTARTPVSGSQNYLLWLLPTRSWGHSSNTGLRNKTWTKQKAHSLEVARCFSTFASGQHEDITQPIIQSFMRTASECARNLDQTSRFFSLPPSKPQSQRVLGRVP